MSVSESLLCRSAPWRAFARRLVSWATMRTELSGDVLEIGGGSGAMAERLARMYPRSRVTMTDVDDAMVDSARARLARLPNAGVRRADSTALPYGEESFDVVVSFLMLHHVIDWEAAIAEAARVLRPGGRLVGYDFIETRFATVLHRVDRSPYRLMPLGGFESAARRAGLVPHRIRHTRYGGLVRFDVRKP